MKRTLSLAYIGLSCATIAVCSMLTVPAAVPFTLQTLAILLTVGLFGWKRGTLAVLLYLAIGAMGVPVFSSFQGGFGVFLGPTGGFLWGFLPTALVTGLLLGKKPPLWRRFAAMGAGMLVLYLLGSLWFSFGYTGGATSFWESLLLCCVPYLLPDAVKVAIAALLSHRCASLIK